MNNYDVPNKKKIKPSVTAIIQARMQSNRLPGKVMLPLADKPLLHHVIERTKHINGVDKVVVATCGGDENIAILKLAESMNCDTFVGSMENVLERYYLAAEKFGGDFIVRVTADNPFVDVEYASINVDIAVEAMTDLCSPVNLPLGAAIEIIKREALAETYRKSYRPYHFEHVSTYIKEHPELFIINRYQADIKNTFEKLRLTVDTQEDYTLAEILYRNLYDNGPFNINKVIKFLEKNPDLVNINSGIKQHHFTHYEKAGVR